MTVTTHSGISRREVLMFFYKYRLRLLLAFLIPFALSVFASTLPTPRYKAGSVLIVRMGSEYIYQPEVGPSGSGPNSVIPFGRDQMFKSEVAILNSADLHAQVIQAIGLETLFPELVHPTGLSRFISSVRESLASLVDSDAESADKEMTQEEINQRRMAKAVDKFGKRFDILLEKESAVIHIAFEHRDYALATKALQTLLDLYFDKRKQLYMEPRATLAEGETARRREQSEQAALAVEEFRRRNRLHSLADQRTDLLARRSEAQQQSLAIRSPALEQRIASYGAQLDRLDALERELGLLEHEAKIAAESYRVYSTKLDEARAYDNLQQQRADSVRVIQPPTAPSEPKRLQPLILIGGFFLSLLSMIAVAALTEFTKRGFLTPEQIERSTGLPVLAVIPVRK